MDEILTLVILIFLLEGMFRILKSTFTDIKNKKELKQANIELNEEFGLSDKQSIAPLKKQYPSIEIKDSTTRTTSTGDNDAK